MLHQRRAERQPRGTKGVNMRDQQSKTKSPAVRSSDLLDRALLPGCLYAPIVCINLLGGLRTGGERGPQVLPNLLRSLEPAVEPGYQMHGVNQINVERLHGAPQSFCCILVNFPVLQGDPHGQLSNLPPLLRTALEGDRNKTENARDPGSDRSADNKRGNDVHRMWLALAGDVLGSLLTFGSVMWWCVFRANARPEWCRIEGLQIQRGCAARHPLQAAGLLRAATGLRSRDRARRSAEEWRTRRQLATRCVRADGVQLSSVRGEKKSRQRT